MIFLKDKRKERREILEFNHCSVEAGRMKAALRQDKEEKHPKNLKKWIWVPNNTPNEKV